MYGLAIIGDLLSETKLNLAIGMLDLCSQKRTNHLLVGLVTSWSDSHERYTEK
jgi:hypothetical protein